MPHLPGKRELDFAGPVKQLSSAAGKDEQEGIRPLQGLSHVTLRNGSPPFSVESALGKTKFAGHQIEDGDEIDA